MAAIAGVVLARPYLSGIAGPAIFLVGVAILAAWGAIALHAHARAARRRAVFGLPASDGSAVEILVLAPLLVAGWTMAWMTARVGASPDGALADYVSLWRGRDAVVAAERLVRRPSPAELQRAWDNQLAALRDELVRLDAENPDAGIDPASPLDTVRFEPAGDGRVAVTVARRETVRELLFGLLPTTSQRRVPIARLGTVGLVLVDDPPAIPGGPPIRHWRIDFVEILGERAGGGG